MKKTVITHVWNEERMLPLWLKHHVPLFDEGVVIDYHSTDATRDIVKELAPHWRLVPSASEKWHWAYCDIEVMAVENMIDGWKVALTCYEYLLSPYLTDICKDMDRLGYAGFSLVGTTMCDPPALRSAPVDPNVPLIRQRHWGRPFEYEENGLRNRLVHRAPNGRYHLKGRHTNSLSGVFKLRDYAYCFWYGFSPFEYIKQRRMQTISNLDPDALKDEHRHHHFDRDGSVLESLYAEVSPQTVDLRGRPQVEQFINWLPERY